MISIKEFTDIINIKWATSTDETFLDWNEILEQHGYYSVAVNFMRRPSGTRLDISKWCRQQFGDDHFVWTGSKFWFETEQAAVMFTLRWGNGD